ncbi:Uncharacterized protein PECH_007136 [Penicillium ucsense]|uniref:Isochorismatase-like domain-containing protein n=1 Tax=Penicillium ucsense TaxID=2839758 RepID=A0A8J8W100_9EURO|nr:Uncharacterized protein PECM_006853 [Penicillium ucsense]KAF7735158.1 Uncharacterized protein PECH_007136 [Penicillium ucsense]
MSVSQVIGNHTENYWLYDPASDTFDLSRGSKSDSLITLETTTQKTRLDPARTVLLLIDLQNFFLHPAIRPRKTGTPSPAEAATEALLRAGIPAARRHGIRIIWLCWGLTEPDLSQMPPAIVRTFGCFQDGRPAVGHATDPNKTKTPTPSLPDMRRVKDPALYKGLGTELGPVRLSDQETVAGGAVLMRGSWNATLFDPFHQEYTRSQDRSLSTATDLRLKPDVLFHKYRMSGLWGAGSELETFLQREGITTLLFGGVNTDQCVGSTLTDAFSKGYDCILLRDGVGTGTPYGASTVWEYNSMNCWGFVTTCDALADASVEAH